MLREEMTEVLTLRDVAKLFPTYDIVRVWISKCGEEKPDGSFAGHTAWFYRAKKRFSDLEPIKAASMIELIGKITVGAEVYGADPRIKEVLPNRKEEEE